MIFYENFINQEFYGKIPYKIDLEEGIKQMPAKADFHLPGLFEFIEFYKVFLPLYKNHREWFYKWANIASIYGAPADCLWGGGRVGFGQDNISNVLSLLKEYEISGRLTFSNSLIQKKHLADKKCNNLCALFEKAGNSSGIKNGVIVHSDLLLEYLEDKFPGLYFVSSTTKVITDFDLLKKELQRKDFRFVVPDFRFNNQMEKLCELNGAEKSKMEFLVNECCWTGCKDRKICYENVSRKSLGEDCADHICKAPGGKEGYLFSKAMENPSFISGEDIVNRYLPAGFVNFKIEGRSLGSAILLEFLLYYLVKPQYHLKVREAIYLDSSLDLF